MDLSPSSLLDINKTRQTHTDREHVARLPNVESRYLSDRWPRTETIIFKIVNGEHLDCARAQLECKQTRKQDRDAVDRISHAIIAIHPPGLSASRTYPEFSDFNCRHSPLLTW